MATEVILHYRQYESDPTQLPKITEKAIQDFSTRPPSRFIPWFPHDESKLPVKPKRSPPVISEEVAEDVRQYFTLSEHSVKSQSYDATVDLLEFQPSLEKQHLIHSHTLNQQMISGNLDEKFKKGRQHNRRSWSVSLVSTNCTENISSMSKNLLDSIKALHLHSRYRARWVIEHTVCNNQTLEEIWVQLNRIIKHNELPSCNATIQRHIGQIWVFCDVMYCEYVGNILKEKLALTGKINLFVRKFGIIFSM